MDRNVHSLIKAEYEKRQKAAADSMRYRRNEAYAKAPQLEEIESRIRAEGIKYNKMILFGTSPVDRAITELAAKINVLKNEKEYLLVEAGYSTDYLDMAYQCPQCRDTGYIENDSGAEKCICYKQQLIIYLYAQSNLKLADTENFSSFDESFYPCIVDEKRYKLKISPQENILRIKDRCFHFIDKFSLPEEKNLFFSGPSGVGKTFMSSCVARELLNKGRTVLYLTAPVLFDIISEYKMKAFNEDEFEDISYKNIFDAELLIIDDLGTENPSPARFTELLNILNIRQVNNLSKPCKTIISTNMEARELYEYYKERVASRIIGGFDIYWFAGDDIRRLKKLAR